MGCSCSNSTRNASEIDSSLSTRSSGFTASSASTPVMGSSVPDSYLGYLTWHPQGPIHPQPSPVPLHFGGRRPPTRRQRGGRESGARRHVVARGGWVDVGG